MEHIVGIGEYVISTNADDVLKTFSLGTCIGLVIYSKTNRVMGMAHIALPDSGINKVDSMSSPARYADRAVDLLVKEMTGSYACRKTDLEAAVIGGFESQMTGNLRIGERNIEMVEKRLKRWGLNYNATETGGYRSRTVVAHVESGEVEIVSYPMMEMK